MCVCVHVYQCLCVCVCACCVCICAGRNQGIKGLPTSVYVQIYSNGTSNPEMIPDGYKEWPQHG